MANVTLELNRIAHLTNPELSYEKNIALSPRDTTDIKVKVKYVMYGETDPYVDLCSKGVINELFALISSTFSFKTLWTNGLDIQVKVTQYLFCTEESIISHVA